MLARVICSLLLSVGLAAGGGAATVSVSAGANPWLAGMPSPSTASLGDVCSKHRPAELTAFTLTPGGVLRFSAEGLTDHCDDGACGLASAEGDAIEGTYSHVTGAENGIANLLAPIDALIGVFLDAIRPDLGLAPGALDFSTTESRDFESLSPLLKQPFFIGDGFRDDGVTAQSFIVPMGAARLFLGTMDGFGWYNNTGHLTVTVTQALEAGAQVLEPGTLALVLASLLWIPFCSRVGGSQTRYA